MLNFRPVFQSTITFIRHLNVPGFAKMIRMVYIALNIYTIREFEMNVLPGSPLGGGEDVIRSFCCSACHVVARRAKTEGGEDVDFYCV